MERNRGQHVADGEGGPLATVHELARVHALGRDEPLLLSLKPERVTERDLAQRGDRSRAPPRRPHP